MLREDTIAAVATAYGEGGIGIIRISGSLSADILNKLFLPSDNQPVAERKLTYGKIIDPANGKMVDEVMAVFLPGPSTYTREDVAEIDCHGSVPALRKTLMLVLEAGARLAEQGEFTKRAFLAGRIDLSQAEAVIDLVRAKTDRGHDLALDQLSGVLSTKIREIRQAMLNELVNLTVNLDYPDEDIEEITYEKLIKSISSIGETIEKLLSSAGTGRMVREGIQVAIAGSPNVGKSSLMNALLRENRAIVTDIPGTTRDTIEETISLRGIPVCLTDTAGIRRTEDMIERMGMHRSRQAFDRADLILFVLDGSDRLTEEDRRVAGSIEGKKTICLINKADLGTKMTTEEVLSVMPGAEIIFTSMIREEGISALETRIERMVFGGEVKQGESLMITNARQEALAKRAAAAVSDALSAARDRIALDFVEVDLRRGYELLGEIIGETASDDIIEAVFANFCLGK